MKPLEDMSIGHRITLTVVIVLIILFAMAFAGWISGRWDEAPAQAITQTKPPQMYQGIPFDAHLLLLDRRSLEEAYHQQLIFLFTVCLKDGCKDPTYFQNGLRNARRFYGEAARQIATREKELMEKGIIAIEKEESK